MGYPENLDNAHLVGPDGRPRLWWAYRDDDFPLCALEPYVVVDGNPQHTRRISLPGGGVREWKLRDLSPSAQKQEGLRGFYQELRESITQYGIKVPVLIWECPEGRYYVRYGASRVKVARDLGLKYIPAVICSYTERPGLVLGELCSPSAVLRAFGELASVGWLEVSHERVDAHHLEPVL